MRKIALILGLSTAFLAPNVLAQDFSDEFLFDSSELPVVLTAARLKQPKAEVPASVTVIEAEQIKAWGARTIPELMRFVPGMAVGGNRDETSETVVYH
ncbi:MAG: TonB-dependent receptor plug domain-containing protein, partial [Venatoribacter sp.]